MEKELDNIILAGKSTPFPKIRAETSIETKEQVKILSKILSKRGQTGITVPDLRSYLPVQIINDEHLEEYLNTLESEGKVFIKEDFVIDMSEVQVKDSELIDYFQSSVREKEETTVYKLSELFADNSEPVLKAKFLTLYQLHMRRIELLFWIGPKYLG
jgi:hypothetical protein